MNEELRKQYKDYFDYVEIESEHVSKELVDYVLINNPNVDAITFSEDVKYFDEEAFFGKNCEKFRFNTAINLKSIGKSCFERAYNVVATGAFCNVEKVDKNAFSVARIHGFLSMIKLKYVPTTCFNYAEIDSLELPALRECYISAFSYARIGRTSFPEGILKREPNLREINNYNMYIEK